MRLLGLVAFGGGFVGLLLVLGALADALGDDQEGDVDAAQEEVGNDAFAVPAELKTKGTRGRLPCCAA